MFLSDLKLLIGEKNSHQALASKWNTWQICKAALLVVNSYSVNEIFNMAGDSQHIMNFTFVFHWYQYTVNVIYFPENMKLMNGKQKVLFGSKQLKTRCTL